MTAAALLADLRKRGASIAAVGDRLRIEAPAGTVTPEMREVLTRHKAALLAMLSRGAGDSELCEHVANDPDLADWYTENSHLRCARCWLAGAPLRSWLQ
jgi:hypothetical protein